MFSYERNCWKSEHVIRNSIGNEIWSKKRKLFLYFLFFSKIAPRWGQIGQSYLALGRAKLRKSSKVEFIGANSDFGGVEMVPVPPVLAQIVQNEPWWAKLALEKLGPIWLLGSIWLFSFYSVATTVRFRACLHGSGSSCRWGNPPVHIISCFILIAFTR